MSNRPSPATDFFLSVLDKIFTPETTIIGRIIGLIIMFAMVVIWYKGEALMEMYKTSRFEDYQEAVNMVRIADFETSAVEQLQIAYISSGSDFAAVYEYRPKNINNFYNMVAYEGELPKGIDPSDVTGYPIDKTSNEYRTQLTGKPYSSTDQFDFLPVSPKTEVDMGYLFSCPIFNLDNIYSGMVSLMWKEKPKHTSEVRLEAICEQASRTLGRIK